MHEATILTTPITSSVLAHNKILGVGSSEVKFKEIWSLLNVPSNSADLLKLCDFGMCWAKRRRYKQATEDTGHVIYFGVENEQKLFECWLV